MLTPQGKDVILMFIKAETEVENCSPHLMVNIP